MYGLAANRSDYSWLEMRWTPRSPATAGGGRRLVALAAGRNWAGHGPPSQHLPRPASSIEQSLAGCRGNKYDAVRIRDSKLTVSACYVVKWHHSSCQRWERENYCSLRSSTSQILGEFRRSSISTSTSDIERLINTSVRWANCWLIYDCLLFPAIESSRNVMSKLSGVYYRVTFNGWVLWDSIQAEW